MNEDLFVVNRKNAITVTEKQIKIILWYVVECYLLTLKDNAKYSKTWVKNHTTYKFENYLKNQLVEDYLIKNKDLLKQKTLILNDINFGCETEKNYIDSQDGKKKPDKIDIYINKLGLRDVWKENDENIYFAIECKRIEKLSNVNYYISDIEKFSNRNYLNTRLPFEGQLAFIENPLITHIQLSDKVNKKLKEKTAIITNNFLSPLTIHSQFNGIYLSAHKRNTDKQKSFTVYHLLFDYSNIVVDY
ncbi:MAG: hypothetical protein LBK94_01650 [Prevotellaceae bacterium]|jgi:hypothetical protein|nr:hypothetical protein [Prevotellaceae bacterium]